MAYEDEERHHTYSDVQSQVQPGDEVILRFASGTLVIRPFRGRKRVRWLCADVSLDLGEVLEELDEEVGHLRVRELKKPIHTYQHRKARLGETGWVGHTCCPRQIRGPALKGRKMNGLGIKYFSNRSSRNRSGSNSDAISKKKKRILSVNRVR